MERGDGLIKGLSVPEQETGSGLLRQMAAESLNQNPIQRDGFPVWKGQSLGLYGKGGRRGLQGETLGRRKRPI